MNIATLVVSVLVLAAVIGVGVARSRTAPLTAAVRSPVNSPPSPKPQAPTPRMDAAQVAGKVALLSDPQASQLARDGALIELGCAHDHAAIPGIVAYALTQTDEYRLELACASLYQLDLKASREALAETEDSGIAHVRETFEHVDAHGLSAKPTL